MLSYLMLGQSDSTGLILFAEEVNKIIPQSSKQNHLNVILTALHKNRAAGKTNLARVLHTIAEMTNRRSIIILISDLLDDTDDIYKGLSHLKYLKHDVILFQTMDTQELNLNYDGLVQFEDLESKATIRTFPQSMRQAYRQRVSEFIDGIKKTTGNSKIDYCLLDTSEPLDRALIKYLDKRKRLM